MCVDLIGPWSIQTTDKETPISLLSLTIIDPARTPLPDNQSETVAIAFDLHWLCKYPHPVQCIHDNRSEFVGVELEDMLASYVIPAIIRKVADPLANAIIEQVHQVMSNMLRTANPLADPETTQFRIEQQLHATQLAINTTYHTTLESLPAQLVFGRDMIMPTTY